MYKQAFWEITSIHQNYVQIFTDGSEVDQTVAAAAVSSIARNSPFSCRLKDYCSIYTAELQAIMYFCFLFFLEILSALQAHGKLKPDHPLLIQIQELLQKLKADQKEIVSMRVP